MRKLIIGTTAGALVGAAICGGSCMGMNKNKLKKSKKRFLKSKNRFMKKGKRFKRNLVKQIAGVIYKVA